MIISQTIILWGGYIISVILIIINGIKAYRSDDKGVRIESDRIRQEVIDTYKERNKQLEEKLTLMQSQLTQFGIDLAKLSGIVEEKDKLIRNLNETILNRNPSLEKTLASINNFLETIYKQGATLATKTDEQTTIIKSQVKREGEIDSSTRGKRGNIMRKENKK